MSQQRLAVARGVMVMRRGPYPFRPAARGGGPLTGRDDLWTGPHHFNVIALIARWSGAAGTGGGGVQAECGGM